MKAIFLFMTIIMSMMSLGSTPLNEEYVPQNQGGGDADEVYTRVDKMPQFQDQSCMTFTQWVRKNMVYPDEAKQRNIEGTLVASFIVDTLGDVTNVEVLRAVDPSLAEATIELLKKSPRWIPGEDKGIKRRVRFIIPINYKFTYSNGEE